MTNVTITCTATNEIICENVPTWEAKDTLVAYFCDDNTPTEIRDACCALGDAINANDSTYELEAYLACEVTYC